MKHIFNIDMILTVLIMTISVISYGQNEESTGLIGENFSLESALESFKVSKSLKDFEEHINKGDNHINNLDLNGDNEIDYVTVNDFREGDVHAIVLSVIISKEEAQDIATIEVEKDGAESAKLQIVGDEDLYGKDMIVEPYDVNESMEGKGPNVEMTFEKIVLNVWLWPSVRYIYGPQYVVYRSPWRWGYYPGWWRPWRPRTWSVWRPIRTRYTPLYRITPVRRVTRARFVYTPQRRVSKTVTVTHKTSIAKARTTKVSTKNTRTSVASVNSPNGSAVAVKKKTNVKNGNGSVKTTTKTKVKATNGQKTVKGSKKTKVTKSKKGNKKGVKKKTKVKKTTKKKKKT